MNVLVACEFSGVVRDAFRRRGHEAWSCNLEGVEPEGEWPNYHLTGDVRWWLEHPGVVPFWDMLIAFPDCTFLTRSGARWFYHPDDRHLAQDQRRPHPDYPDRRQKQRDALAFVRYLMAQPIPYVAIENPAGRISTAIRKPDQVVQPWQFGHGEVKKTCLWLDGLPKLKPTDVVEGRKPAVFFEPPGPDRAKNRSRTYTGIGEAMADQWGSLPALGHLA